MTNYRRLAKVLLTFTLLSVWLTACGHTPGDRALSGAGIGAGAGAGAALLGAPLLPAVLIGGAVGAATGAATTDKQIDLGK